MAKKKFKLFDAILSVICVVFVAEAAAPAAAIGNSQFFWWIFLIITFLLPYGMIAAELGTAYDDEGGLYDWVRRAYGKKWGSRVAWYYWINFPLWMASLAVMFPSTINLLTGSEMGTLPSILIELAFIWIVVLLSFSRISDSKWILNLSAFIKVFIALVLGGLGIYTAVTRGAANEYTVQSMLPSLNLDSLSYISVILFNFMGFEVITSYASDMENPRKQIPQAIIAGGIAIAVIYIFSSFGIGVAIPTDQISTSSGLMDSLQLLIGKNGVFITIMGILFLVTLFGNMVSWSYGVNYVADYAAKNGSLPKVFAHENKKTEMPTGSAVMNGVVASALVIVAPFLPNQDLFWSFFGLNVVTLLLSYVPLFPTFLKLRKIDPDRERPFKVSGGPVKLRLMVILPMILLLVSIILSCVPLNSSADELSSKGPLAIGTLIAIIIGEIICHMPSKDQKSEEAKE
ncbi:APC family permease [Caproiciproducens galactitolivorans]|uniref:APC family permease n=1 Tax=Caproiciproducens galactitolivorans TaxID=642589 RepID=A0ABT4BSP8_9FIRM|nr:APC family permease [Caproiciproducens galactitolivorans]MCY1712961.1 APC family permease [Caproiciproducens galactitolivorans]